MPTDGSPGPRESSCDLCLLAATRRCECVTDERRNARCRLIRQLLNWLAQLALWGSLASILVGAAVYGIGQNTNHAANAYRGKQLAADGAIGAILAGLAPTIINLLFRAAL